MQGFFNKCLAVLHCPPLVESMDMKPQLGKVSCRVICWFSTMWRISTPKPCIVQRLIVYSYSHIKSCIPGKLYGVTGTFKCANVSTQVTRVSCKRDNHND